MTCNYCYFGAIMFFVILFIHTQSFTISFNISIQNRKSCEYSGPKYITTMREYNKKFADDELKKAFDGNFKLHKGKKEKPLDGSQEALQRKSRDAANTSNEGLEYLSCYADGISATDENCYKGSGVSTQIYLDAEKYYIELHPLYIKRGCVLPGSLNRTFVCKCLLCNDKPSYDSAYYEYTKLSDWEYDNERLKKPLMSVSLMCKVCETKGVNNFLDNICKGGLRCKSKVCGRSQYCFINIAEQTDFVSRGCIRRPIYNKFYRFCDELNFKRIPFHNTKTHNPDLELLQLTRISSKLSSTVDTSNLIFI